MNRRRKKLFYLVVLLLCAILAVLPRAGFSYGGCLDFSPGGLFHPGFELRYCGWIHGLHEFGSFHFFWFRGLHHRHSTQPGVQPVCRSVCGSVADRRVCRCDQLSPLQAPGGLFCTGHLRANQLDRGADDQFSGSSPGDPVVSPHRPGTIWCPHITWFWQWPAVPCC